MVLLSQSKLHKTLSWLALPLSQFTSTTTNGQQVTTTPAAIPAHKEPYELIPLTGIAVSSTGRMFSNYPPGLDPMDTNYTVAELTGNTTEMPYPSLAYNTPPGGRINYSTYPAVSADLNG